MPKMSYLQIIETATENKIFSDIIEPINTLCPISLNEFTSNDQVTIIKVCKHIFDKEELTRWFKTKLNCPSCRHNISVLSEADDWYSLASNSDTSHIIESNEELPNGYRRTLYQGLPNGHGRTFYPNLNTGQQNNENQLTLLPILNENNRNII